MGTSGPTPGGNTTRIGRRGVLALAASVAMGGAPDLAHAAGSAGQLVYGVHILLAPTWFDPAEALGINTSYMLLCALDDAVVKPLPGQANAPCLAQSCSVAEDGLSYEFVLRNEALFHNGEPVTAEDVKFSFERYRKPGFGRIAGFAYTAPYEEITLTGS